MQIEGGGETQANHYLVVMGKLITIISHPTHQQNQIVW